MNSGVLDGDAPVVRTLTAVGVAVDELIMTIRDGGLDHHDTAELLIMLGRHTSIGNRLGWVDAELIAAGRDRGMVEHAGQRNVAKVVESVCLVSPADANRRARAAEQTAGRVSPIGVPLPRLRDQVAAAMAAGAINPEQTAVVCRTLSKLDQAAVDPDQVAVVETELVGHAGQYGPRDLSQLCRRYLDIYDPDGTEPNEQRDHERRIFTMRQTRTGATVGEFRLTGSTGARLAAVLEPLAKPRTTRIDETQPGETQPGETQPDQTEPDRAGDAPIDASGSDASALGVMADPRTREQRLHDALDDACARLLRAGGLPESGGTPAAVMINIDLNDLLHHTTGLTDPPTSRCSSNDQSSAVGQPSGSPRNWAPGSAAGWSPSSEWVPGHAAAVSAAEWSPSPEWSPTATHSASSTMEFDEASELTAPLTGMIMIKHVITNTIDTGAPVVGTMITEPITAWPASTAPTMTESLIIEAGEAKQSWLTSLLVKPPPRARSVTESIVSSMTTIDDTQPDNSTMSSTGPGTPYPPTPHPVMLDPGRSGQPGVGRPRYGTTSRGQTISIPELLRLAGEAEIYPVVCTTNGQVLDLGRSRRIATKTQTMALISRDGGCSFPGCDIAPEWCERHHVIGWEHNGPTDLDNLTLLCSYHHRQFLQRGWQVTIDNGIPQWIPPHWLDPKQRPRINHRITTRIHQQTLLTDHGR